MSFPEFIEWQAASGQNSGFGMPPTVKTTPSYGIEDFFEACSWLDYSNAYLLEQREDQALEAATIATYNNEASTAEEHLLEGNPWFVLVYKHLTTIFERPAYRAVPINPFDISEQAWLNTLVGAADQELNNRNEIKNEEPGQAAYATTTSGIMRGIVLGRKQQPPSPTLVKHEHRVRIEADQDEFDQEATLYTTSTRIIGRLEQAGKAQAIGSTIARELLEYVATDGPAALEHTFPKLEARLLLSLATR
jgi:hypothetical protein